MTRSLIALAFGISLLMSPSKDVRAEPKLETGDLKPHEQIQEYLDSSGVGREEFRMRDYLSTGRDGTPYYTKVFLFEKEVFIERREIICETVLNKDGTIPLFPIVYIFRGILYYDPLEDGFNGNEIGYQNLTELIESKWNRELEETPVTYNSNERGLCI